jgi:hypothetical protein
MPARWPLIRHGNPERPLICRNRDHGPRERLSSRPRALTAHGTVDVDTVDTDVPQHVRRCMQKNVRVAPGAPPLDTGREEQPDP